MTKRGGGGRLFQPKNPGRPKGALDRRTIVGIETARALTGRAVDRLSALIDSRSPRVSLEAVKTILGYAWGLPKATLEVSGGFGNLAAELAAALQEARARRAALDVSMPVAGLLDAPDGIQDVSVESDVDVEVVKDEKDEETPS